MHNLKHPAKQPHNLWSMADRLPEPRFEVRARTMSLRGAFQRTHPETTVDGPQK